METMVHDLALQALISSLKEGGSACRRLISACRRGISTCRRGAAPAGG